LEDCVLEVTTDSGMVAEVLMFKTEISSFESEEEMLREEDMVGRRKKKTAISHTREILVFLILIFVDKTRLVFMYKIGIHIIYVCISKYYFYVKNKGA
jgi:hypothetical protein